MANDKALQALLRRSCGLWIEIHERTVFPLSGGFRSVLECVDLHAVSDRPDAERGVAIVQKAMQPAPERDLARELTRLRVMTKAKDRSGVDTNLEALVWLDELKRFPGDVAIEALREWPSQPNGTWWPSWHEMEELLNKKSSHRRAMLSKLREAA